MDKIDYIKKMEEKLKDESTYIQLHTDPTSTIKRKLSTRIKEIYENNEIEYAMYRKLLPTQTQIPRMYGQVKIHKEGNPMREIVDANGSVLKEVDKYLTNIIKTYIGNNKYYIKNSQHFVNEIKDITIENNETLISYDVKALYTQVFLQMKHWI